MTPETADRLSVLQTHWSLLRHAHGGTADAERLARFQLVTRYGGAAYRYLCAACGDSDAAMDLAQEFGLRVLRGDLKNATPARGRFRDYVKGILLNLVADHFRSQSRRPGPLPDDNTLEAVAHPEVDEREFTVLWRAELLDRTWDSLRDEGGKQPLYDVLRWRVDHPQQEAEVAAQELSAHLDRELTGVYYRQLLHRARERFAELLLIEVVRSLGTDAPDVVHGELAELELLSYCRPATSLRNSS